MSAADPAPADGHATTAGVDDPVIVLHAPGDAEGGVGWARAFDAAGHRAVAPTLAGHRGTPPPMGGSHDLADPGYLAAATLTDDEVATASAVVGVGASGWSATVMAVAGVGRGLVLVDGLGDPWRTLDDRLSRRRARLRHLADVVTGLAPAPETPGPGLAPSVAWFPDPIGDRDLVVVMVAALTVPTLIVRSPASAVPDEEVVAAFGGGATVVETPAASPEAIAPIVADWLRPR